MGQFGEILSWLWYTQPHPGTMWYCFVGKNFVVRLSTTENHKNFTPRKIPAIWYITLVLCVDKGGAHTCIHIYIIQVQSVCVVSFMCETYDYYITCSTHVYGQHNRQAINQYRRWDQIYSICCVLHIMYIHVHTCIYKVQYAVYIYVLLVQHATCMYMCNTRQF